MAPSWLRPAIGVAVLASAYCAGELLPPGTRSADPALTAVCALILAVAIFSVAARLQVGRRLHFLIWLTFMFLNLASVAVEGTLFAPAASPPSELAANLIRLLIMSAVMAASVALFGDRNGEAPPAPTRSPAAWAWRIIAAATVYVVLYFVVGGLNYTFVTHPYYEAHAGSVTVPPAATVLAYEPLRGIAIAISTAPLVLALRLRFSVAAAAAVTGAMLFVAGGLAPLLPQASLPLYLRVASLWEIFAQNFFTGLACTYLFLSGGRSRYPAGHAGRA